MYILEIIKSKLCLIHQYILLQSGGISGALILHQCFGMNHTGRVGGSVFWLARFRMKFLIWHLSLAKCGDLGGKQKAERRGKKKERKRIWPLPGDACFHGDAGACACVYDDLTNAYLLLTSVFFCQDADRTSASTWTTVQSRHSQALTQETTLHSRHEKSPEDICEDIDNTGSHCLCLSTAFAHDFQCWLFSVENILYWYWSSVCFRVLQWFSQITKNQMSAAAEAWLMRARHWSKTLKLLAVKPKQGAERS